uniref:AAA+ ATPase At3g28540-like C-terminal domain-containing protein n=1 Tax=Salix viminalis TaxID=40686 RepID=A0A6N2K8A5_SALVM
MLLRSIQGARQELLEVESHELFGKIEELMGQTEISPADVAENLMPKSDEEDVETCLKCLIEALEASMEEARKKSEEEAMLKAENAGKQNGEASSSSEEVAVVRENGVALSEEVKENGVIAQG